MTAPGSIEKEASLSEGRQAVDAIARAFVDARHGGQALTDYPGEIPESLDDGYRIQEVAISLFGGQVAGWKVGRIPDALVARHGTDRLAGPIFADCVVEAKGDDAPLMPVFAGGFAAAEAEFMLRIGSLPESFDRDWTNEAIIAYVDAVHIGIEVAGSPFPGINEHGPAVTISDFGNNNGLVIGAAIDPNSDFIRWPVALTIDGIEAGSGTAATMLDGPFGAVRFLFELAATRPLPLAAGQWISTGAVTGVHPVRAGAEVEAVFGDGLRVRCRIGG